MKRVSLNEYHVYERMVPLVSGYLQAYAQADEQLRDQYTFTKHSTTIKVSEDEALRHLLDDDADVYAFSCYVWNMGLVRRVVRRLREARPDAHIVLGGPQVIRHANRYLEPDDERMVVCNGEGEISFTEYLRALATGGDLADVEGFSFYRDGDLMTTPDRTRLKELDQIPSPYLTGVFDDEKYTMSIIETNRGCPFRCGFCFWGAATNDRVYRFDEQRVRDEITWMADNDVLFLYIADANWGMLSRDVEISQHIADCTKNLGAPNLVYFSASKNKPHTVSQIAEIFMEAGLVSAQPVSMQTLEPESLELIQRSNIKLKAFEEVANGLRKRGIGSFVELIWPLPGETLDTFKNGIDALCRSQAQSLIVYPHVLLNNTPMQRDKERFGLVIRPTNEDISEAQLVVATDLVSEHDFAEGLRFIYAISAVQNTRALYGTARYLSQAGIMSHRDLLSSFVDYWRTLDPADPIVSYVEWSINDYEFYTVENTGIFTHKVLHEERVLFGQHLREFVRSQPWWSDERARALFELDLLNRPHIYSNTPLDSLDDLSQEAVTVVDRDSRSYVVDIRPEYRALANEIMDLNLPEEGLVKVNHSRKQYPFMPGQEKAATGAYCHGIIEKSEVLVPKWEPLVPAYASVG